MFQVKTSSKEIWNAERHITFLLRNYLEPKLFLAEITLCRNYPVLELSFAGTILCRNYPLQELSFAGTIYFYNCSVLAIIFISHRLDPVSFEHLVLAPLCEPKSHHIIAVQYAWGSQSKNKFKKCIELIPKYFRICSHIYIFFFHLL